MKTNSILFLDEHVDAINQIFTCNENNNWCFVDLSTSDKIDIKLDITNDQSIKINWLTINNQDIDKKVNVHINLINDSNNVLFNSHTLLYGKSKVFFKVYVTNESNRNNKVNIKISSIINNDLAKFSACPIFDFSTNNIDAKHSVNIGGLNKDELCYLMSRGVDENLAKFLLIKSKINIVLDLLDDSKKNMLSKRINEIVGIEDEC